MTPRELQDHLRDLLEAVLFARDDAADPANALAEHVAGIHQIATFDDVGVLTRDKGLVIETRDGAEFQLTIVPSRLPARQTGPAACSTRSGGEEDRR
ncbi:MAG: hypothetical protein HUU22_15720 [Phycisphaerae bacterium]|nr:hypothetical protein [Phycisphaerae bacterium]NUQ47469.1 hypothetical protein [Phycisphaerae bacterium]